MWQSFIEGQDVETSPPVLCYSYGIWDIFPEEYFTTSQLPRWGWIHKNDSLAGCATGRRHIQAVEQISIFRFYKRLMRHTVAVKSINGTKRSYSTVVWKRPTSKGLDDEPKLLICHQNVKRETRLHVVSCLLKTYAIEDLISQPKRDITAFKRM